MLTLGQQIRMQRRLARITQPELARVAGVNKMTIYRLERDEREPYWETVGRVAEALGLSLDDLWTQYTHKKTA